MPELEEAFWV